MNLHHPSSSPDSASSNQSKLGKLVIFEGTEGCGKTTQVNLTCEWLRSQNSDVVVTREPGGTELGVELRRLLLQSPQGSIADRAEYVERDLKPQIKAGKIILCDRFIDSTIAYQGFGRGLDLNLIAQLNAIATAGLARDIVFWLDIDPEVGLQRKTGDNQTLDRIEQEKIDFHYRVRRGYAYLASQNPHIIHRLDANLAIDQIQKQIQAILTQQMQVN